MSEVKHTPGPWLRDGAFVYALGKDGLNRMDFKVHCHRNNSGGVPEAVATAALIETAPELLEALQEVMSWIRNWDPNFTADAEWPETEAKVDAAIAKATGKAVA